jgi:transcriptional regulator with XRE-family HTH domain
MMQETGDGPSVVRSWQLAAMVKAMREQAGMTQEDAADALRQGTGNWSKSKVSRIEKREHHLKVVEAMQLLDVYQIRDAASRDRLINLAAEARQKTWWASFIGDLPEEAPDLLSIEAGLVAFRDFQTMLVHGLLQTSDYARAVINAINPAGFAPEKVERMVAVRMVRQRILDKEDAPSVHMIVDQTILERVVGKPSIMRDQLRKLLDATESPNITIQILPKEIGGSPGLEGPFSILTLPEPVPDIAYIEGPGGSLFLENREQVRLCTMRFGILTSLALSRAESIDVIAEAAKGFE